MKESGYMCPVCMNVYNEPQLSNGCPDCGSEQIHFIKAYEISGDDAIEEE